MDLTASVFIQLHSLALTRAKKYGYSPSNPSSMVMSVAGGTLVLHCTAEHWQYIDGALVLHWKAGGALVGRWYRPYISGELLGSPARPLALTCLKASNSDISHSHL